MTHSLATHNVEAVILITENAGNNRRLKINHHMPRHGHDVGLLSIYG